MAKQKRKQAPAKPITTHQLFPVVVGLWFGALFGIGSLAVRPSLLESLVIRSRVDLIVSAAAPPLGVTARILVALVLSAIGAAIGIAIARRLARPKQEHRERKRGAGSVVEDSDKLHGGWHYADANTHTSVSVSEDLRPDLSGEDAGTNGGMLAQRRRSLAIEHNEADFVPHELAPLPGGAPQILDIGEVHICPDVAEAPLDLSAFAAPSAPEPSQSEQAQFAPPPSPAQLDWNNAVPVQLAPGAEQQPSRQVFQPREDAVPELATPEISAQHQHDVAQKAAAAAADGHQVFGLPAPAVPADATRQIFGQSVSGDHVDQEFVKAAGFKTSVFDTETPRPLFAPVEGATASIEPASFSVPPAPAVQTYEVPEAHVPPSQLLTETDDAVRPVAAAIAPEPEPALPSPAGLGMDDLAARLAESMARRRAARSGLAFKAQAETATASPVSVTLETPVMTAEPAIPAAFEAPVAAPVNPTATPAIPEPYTPPISAEPIAPVAPPFAVPLADLQPAPVLIDPAPQITPRPEVATIAQFASVPQGMRPLDLGGFEEDHAPLDSVFPPRMIAMPIAPIAAVVAPAPAPFAAPVDEAEIANEGVAEESYGSLLGIAQPAATHTGFVRIEEPEADAAATEPVVIFPGQMTRPIVPVSSEDAGSFRRFDAPASAGQGQPIAANQAVSEVDSEEAQRALRSALANLQRMSGVA